MSHSGRLLPEELEILDPPPVPSMVDWAPRELILPKKETRLSGPFSFEWAPWMRDLCNWFCDPLVREITLLGPLQFGKTLFMSVCLAYAIRFMPMPTMLVMADRQSLNKRMKRLRALFEANPFLMAQIDGDIRNLNVGEATELKDLLLVLAWVTSETALAESPEGIEFCDEVALWPMTVQNSEMSPLDHLRGRQETYAPVRKMVKVSSARETGDLADEEYESADRCEFWVPCHKCSYWHIPRWHDKEQPGSYAVLDREKDGSWLSLKEYASEDHVRYHCPSCGVVWSDYARGANLQKGIWLPAGVTAGRAGKIEGVVKPSAYKSARVRCLMVHPKLRAIRKMSVDWVRGQLMLKTGQIGGLKNFLNNQEAQPWRDTTADTDAQKLLTHRADYRSAEIATGKPVPWGIQGITIQIDVHDNWFRYLVMGWGWQYESWVIEVGQIETTDTREVESFEPLRPLIVKPWLSADGTWMLPSAVTIDCGYRPEPVKDFCRACRPVVYRGNMIPVLGAARRMNRTYAKVAVDVVLTRYDLNTLELKDRLWRHLFEAQTPGPGYMHLPADLPGYAISELCSEQKIVKARYPVWVQKKEGRDNHTWDAAYHGVFAAVLIGVGTMPPLPQEPTPKPAPAPPTAAPATQRKIRTHYD